jgi:hypothetical protein
MNDHLYYLDTYTLIDEILSKILTKITFGNKDHTIQVTTDQTGSITLNGILNNTFDFDEFILVTNADKKRYEFIFNQYRCNWNILQEIIFPKRTEILPEQMTELLKICPDIDIVRNYVNGIIMFLITEYPLFDYVYTTLLKHVVTYHIQQYVNKVKSNHATNVCQLSSVGDFTLINKYLPANMDSGAILIKNHTGKLIDYPEQFNFILDSGNSVTTYIGENVVEFLKLTPKQFCNVVSHGVGGGVLQCNQYVNLSFALKKMPQKIYTIIAFVRKDDKDSVLVGQNSGLDVLFDDNYSIKGKFDSISPKAILHKRLISQQKSTLDDIRGRYGSLLGLNLDKAIQARDAQLMYDPSFLTMCVEFVGYIEQHVSLFTSVTTQTDMETLSHIWKFMMQLKTLLEVVAPPPPLRRVFMELTQKIDHIFGK